MFLSYVAYMLLEVCTKHCFEFCCVTVLGKAILLIFLNSYLHLLKDVDSLLYL